MNFVEYLVGESIIQERNLARALLVQKTDWVPLGRLALQKGSISGFSLRFHIPPFIA